MHSQSAGRFVVQGERRKRSDEAVRKNDGVWDGSDFLIWKAAQTECDVEEDLSGWEQRNAAKEMIA